MLTEDIDFMITDNKGNELITLTTVSIERVYEFNEQDILASSNEERRIRNEMHKDIARKILNRIRSLPRSESLSESSFGGS
jgi:outer membrane lipopolysaccharide assembly protein LptE/RlpB